MCRRSICRQQSTRTLTAFVTLCTMVVLVVFTTMPSVVLADVVSRASAPLYTATSSRGCGYDQNLLRYLCLLCNGTSCSVYSMTPRGPATAVRTFVYASLPALMTVRSGRRLAYIFYVNKSLIQYNLDNWDASPLDTGFTYANTVVACGGTLSAPDVMTVAPDGKAYGILQTASTCANTLYVIAYIVPTIGSTVGGGQTTITMTYASEANPGVNGVIGMTSSDYLDSNTPPLPTLYIAMTGGTCSGVSYVKIVPDSSVGSTSQLLCGSTTCSLSTASVTTAFDTTEVMLAFSDHDQRLFATRKYCHDVVSMGSTAPATLRVKAGDGTSGYVDGYALSEAKLQSPASPAVIARRLLVVTLDLSSTTTYVGRLIGVTSTASVTRSATPRSISEHVSASNSESPSGPTLTVSPSTTAAHTFTSTESSSSSASLTPSEPTITEEVSVSWSHTAPTPTMTHSPSASKTRSPPTPSTSPTIVSQSMVASSTVSVTSTGATRTPSSTITRGTPSTSDDYTTSFSESPSTSPSNTVTLTVGSITASPTGSMGMSTTRNRSTPSESASGSGVTKSPSFTREFASGTTTLTLSDGTPSRSRSDSRSGPTISLSLTCCTRTLSMTSERRSVSPTSSMPTKTMSTSRMPSVSPTQSVSNPSLSVKIPSITATQSMSKRASYSTTATLGTMTLKYSFTVPTEGVTVSRKSSTLSLTTTIRIIEPWFGQVQWPIILGGTVGGVLALVLGIWLGSKLGVFAAGGGGAGVGGGSAVAAESGAHEPVSGGGASSPPTAMPQQQTPQLPRGLLVRAPSTPPPAATPFPFASVSKASPLPAPATATASTIGVRAAATAPPPLDEEEDYLFHDTGGNGHAESLALSTPQSLDDHEDVWGRDDHTDDEVSSAASSTHVMSPGIDDIPEGSSWHRRPMVLNDRGNNHRTTVASTTNHHVDDMAAASATSLRSAPWWATGGPPPQPT